MLTDAQKAAYLQNSGACPYCGSEDIEGWGGYDYGELGNTILAKITCNNCDKIWEETYTLSGIEEVS